MRKRSKHVQHLHAIVFAACITAAIGAAILYTDYGFWHETYTADDLIVETKDTTHNPSFNPESPGESMLRFWQEAKLRFSSVTAEGGSLLEGKETYTPSADEGR